MILYSVLRLVTGIALRWFYRDVRVRHADRVPPGTVPLLVVVNHPNALVDALLAGWAMPRRIKITAKATLFENPVLGWFLRVAGVIPLRRASDERRRLTGEPAPAKEAEEAEEAREHVDRARNVDAFRAILDYLERGGAVLIFPEGKSHDEPALAPLRTGPARIALQAHDEGRAPSLAILPIGLVFERKETPRSRVLVDIGEPIVVDQWVATAAGDATHGAAPVGALTEEIDRRLRNVTLNYATTDEAARTRGVAQTFASLLAEPLPLGAADRSLENEVELERRLAQARRLLEGERTDAELQRRAERLLDRLDAFERLLRHEGIAPDDVAISLRRRHGARFAIRESAVLAVAGPIAFWGRLNHWIPFRLARTLGERDMSSRDQPAMRTILAGLVLVLLFYGAAAAAVARVAGGVAAAAYVLSLPIAADVDLRFAERMRRARQRMRTYLRFRRDPELRDRLCAEHAWLTGEIGDISHELSAIGYP